MQEMHDFLLGVFSGVIVAGLLYLADRTRNQIRLLNIKSIFGSDIYSNCTYFISYAILELDKNISQNHPSAFVKPQLANVSMPRPIKADKLISSCELRATYHLLKFFNSYGTCKPMVFSDIEGYELFNKSMVALGGISNFETMKIFENQNNVFFRLDGPKLVSIDGKYENSPDTSGQYDYGIILRITPREFPNRIWIACAGIDEWGTSGTAWYLSNRWEQILKEARGNRYKLIGGGVNDFACIVRVKKGYDESACLMHFLRSSDEVKAFFSKSG